MLNDCAIHKATDRSVSNEFAKYYVRFSDEFGFSVSEKMRFQPMGMVLRLVNFGSLFAPNTDGSHPIRSDEDVRGKIIKKQTKAIWSN